MDDFSRFKVSEFLKNKSSTETAAAFESYIVMYITPEQLSIHAIRTDRGGDFEGAFQQKLDQLKVQHQHTSPGTPKLIGLLRENTIALLEDLQT